MARRVWISYRDDCEEHSITVWPEAPFYREDSRFGWHSDTLDLDDDIAEIPEYNFKHMGEGEGRMYIERMAKLLGLEKGDCIEYVIGNRRVPECEIEPR